MPSSYDQIVQGVVIFAAAALDVYRSRYLQRGLSRKAAIAPPTGTPDHDPAPVLAPTGPSAAAPKRFTDENTGPTAPRRRNHRPGPGPQRLRRHAHRGPPTQAGQKKIAVLLYSQGFEFMVALNDGIKAEAARLGVDVVVLDAREDSAKQTQQIEDQLTWASKVSY